MEEHNNITYIPPPSKASEEVPQSAAEERISSDVTKDHSLENKTESTYSPEKASGAAAMESTYSPEKGSRAPATESTYSPEKASKASAIESTYSPEKASRAPVGREAGLTRIETDKRISIIKAWEDSEKTKADNRARKEMSSILAWENTKGADIEAKLKRKEEELEKKKAAYAEKLKNKLAKIHKEAEMKRADVEAQRGKALIEAQVKAAKYHNTGAVPKNKTWCCGTST